MEKKKKQQSVDVYAAIREMQRLTECGGEFSFSFYKYDRQRHTGGELVRISRARLRSKPMNDVVENADYKLFFTDMDGYRPLNCWQMLITEFNGIPCTLN